MEENKLLFTSEEVDIFFNSELHIVQTVWKGIYAEGERLQYLFNELINALETTKSSIIVADAREMMIISYKDQEWTINDWYPRAVRAGFRHQGLVLSSNTFNEITVKKISQEYDDLKVTTQYFENVPEALEWAKYLRNTEVPPYPRQYHG